VGPSTWLAHKSSKARPLIVLRWVAGLGPPSLEIEHEISTPQNIHAEDMPWEQNTHIGIGSGQFLPDICRLQSNTIKSNDIIPFYFVKVDLKSWQCLDIEALLAKCGQGAMTPGNVCTTVELELCPTWYVRRHPPELHEAVHQKIIVT
jgi:hypothetical protein